VAANAKFFGSKFIRETTFGKRISYHDKPSPSISLDVMGEAKIDANAFPSLREAAASARATKPSPTTCKGIRASPCLRGAAAAVSDFGSYSLGITTLYFLFLFLSLCIHEPELLFTH
jgi:hypothetical protein